MKFQKIIFIALASFFFVQNLEAQDSLQLKTMYQPKYWYPFELSGLAKDNQGNVFVVNDENQRIFRLQHQKIKRAKFRGKANLSSIDKDWEGIDFQGDDCFVLSEKSSSIIGKNKKIRPNFKEYENQTGEDLMPEKWGNAGFEGFCFGNKKLYFAKERTARGVSDSRYILETDLTGKILRKFTIPAKGSKNPDFADIKFEIKDEKEYLYILERNFYFITRLDLATNETVSYSFSKYAGNKKLENTFYKTRHPEYGMAEALLITKDEIWIGFDNNISPVNPENQYVQKYNLEGKQCTIMIFERGDF